MGDQSPIVESWEGDIFAKHLHFQPRVVGDVHFSEFDEPAERHYAIPDPLEQFARTEFTTCRLGSDLLTLLLLPTTFLCCLHLPYVYKEPLEPARIDRVLILNCPVNTTTLTPLPPARLIIPCSNEGSREEKILLSGMPNVYMRNPFFSGVPTAAMIGAPMRLQTLIKAWPIPPAAAWMRTT